jgi:hypothetical protein
MSLWDQYRSGAQYQVRAQQIESTLDKDFYTVREVAELLNVHRKTVDAWSWHLPTKEGRPNTESGDVGDVQKDNPENSLYVKEGRQGSSVARVPGDVPSIGDKTTENGRRLTTDEAEQVKRLVDEGMSHKAGRAEVLGVGSG